MRPFGASSDCNTHTEIAIWTIPLLVLVTVFINVGFVLGKVRQAILFPFSSCALETREGHPVVPHIPWFRTRAWTAVTTTTIDYDWLHGHLFHSSGCRHYFAMESLASCVGVYGCSCGMRCHLSGGHTPADSKAPGFFPEHVSNRHLR